jgi:hypothetical protein
MPGFPLQSTCPLANAAAARVTDDGPSHPGHSLILSRFSGLQELSHERPCQVGALLMSYIESL